MRIVRSILPAAIALAGVSACASHGSSTPATPTVVAGVTEPQAPASESKREARARDLAVAADRQIRQLETMRPDSVDLGVATQIEANIATISQGRDDVLADLGGAAPDRLDYDVYNLSQAMREATFFRPRPLVTPPLIPHAGGQTGANTVSPWR